MPKLTHINSILVIGSGPIKIGQACEFDYSGTQAIKALREEGYRVILINSNPATIMTDVELADVTYIEPITVDYVTQIIAKERPDALIATLGGQTSLNCALALHENGILAQYNVALLGASVTAIQLAEDRALFHSKMQEIGLDVPKSRVAHTADEALHAVTELGLPVIVRSSFTLGGAGSAVIHTPEQAHQLFEQAFALGGNQILTIDEGLIGYKEFELEVVRDKQDNCIVVCGVENVDPLGIHTGDSITVAPIQTLTDQEYQAMRQAAFAVLRAIGVETGGSNVQFAINPQTGRMVVIEMNPRVSRSSALVSKATGFPIAKIAAKLAVGYMLDELHNEMTEGQLPASFEPSVDYVITKIPRFHDEKFNAQGLPLGPQMRSVGEVMAIGSTFAESLHQAMVSLDTQCTGFDELAELSNQALIDALKTHTSNNLWSMAEAFRRGMSVDQVQALTPIDPWFLHQIQQMIRLEQNLCGKTVTDVKQDELLLLKKQGFSDARIAHLLSTSTTEIRALRQQFDLFPVYKCIDTCAGEFRSATAYFYSTYQHYCEAKPSNQKKVMVIGSGPNRIGQGIEFDYVCVKAIAAFANAGFETIMVNCNPETVSTDYDVANKLYFIPITPEKILDVIEKEQPDFVALQFGGQTPLNLLPALQQAQIPLIGLSSDMVNLTEDREQFRTLLHQLQLKQPSNVIVSNLAQLDDMMPQLTFPVIIRPSFILGGVGMEVVSEPKELINKLQVIFANNPYPVLIEEFLHGAIELDVDAISDGDAVFIPAILEHIEAAGIHSGDSACITPPRQLPPAIIQLVQQQTRKIAQALHVKGLINIQFAVQGSDVYVIEVNPRASRTTPFVCKATGIAMVEIAINCMLGQSLAQQRCLSSVKLPYYCVKEAVLPFGDFLSASPVLGPEMKATGEVMGIGRTPHEAFLKAQRAAGQQVPDSGLVFASGLSDDHALLTTLQKAGFTKTTHLDDNLKPDLMMIVDNSRNYLSYAIQHRIAYVSTLEAARIMVLSMVNQSQVHCLEPIQQLYREINHPSKTKHLLTGQELSAAELLQVLDLAAKIKQNPKHYSQALAGKTLAMIFEKPSFRTRLSFTLAMEALGGTTIESVNTTRKTEEARDFIRVLNGYCDAVMVRTHEDNSLQDMATYATIPILNGLSALHHPCQIVADLLSLQESYGYLSGLTVAYIGDGNNILHSLLLMAPQLGLTIHYCCPPGNQPNAAVLAESLQSDASQIVCFDNPQDAVKQAHAVYTDVWVSMGFDAAAREANFAGFQVNERLMEQARPEALFMHCMPMERGKEVSTTLPDDPRSIIFTQSENRLHGQKALLLMFLLSEAPPQVCH